MEHRFSRTETVLGAANLERLAQSTVAVFGLGGVGGYAAEALSRSGIGTLVLVDHDNVALTDLNRQITALQSTLGQPKVTVMAERIGEINPDCQVIAHRIFFDARNQERVFADSWDYVADAIDSVGPKSLLIQHCLDKKIPLISALGTGNKLDPTLLQIADLAQTHTCPLARALRVALRKLGIEQGLTVVYSPEKPVRVGGRTPGSTAFVPPAAGLIMAAHIVKELCRRD